MALKLNKNKNLILRCYECHGQTATLSLKSNLDLKIIKQLNCLETKEIKNHQSDRHSASPEKRNYRQPRERNLTPKIQPWQITTYQLATNNQ